MKTRLYKKFLKRFHKYYYQLFKVGKDGSYELWVMKNGVPDHQNYTKEPEKMYRQLKYETFTGFVWGVKNSRKVPITNF